MSDDEVCRRLRSSRASWSPILLGLLSAGTLLASADFAGTWKLNVERSTLVTQYASDVIAVEPVGALSFRMVYDLVTLAGQKSHSEVVRTFDGVSRPVQGANGVTEIDDHPDDATWRSRRLRDGRVIDERRAVIAGDIQTVQRTTINASGETVKEVLVFERQ